MLVGRAWMCRFTWAFLCSIQWNVLTSLSTYAGNVFSLISMSFIACAAFTHGGHSHMSADIKCLLIDPLYYADLTPNNPPFFFSPHPMTPFFSTFISILHTNCKFLHAFWEIYQFCGNFNKKLANLGLKLHFLHTKWPPFLEVHI